MFKHFDEDITTKGMLLGFISPPVCFTAFYLVVFLVYLAFFPEPFITLNSLVMLSIAPNFLLVRRSFNAKKMENNGKGVLATTFVYIMLFFLARNLLLGIHLPGLKI